MKSRYVDSLVSPIIIALALVLAGCEKVLQPATNLKVIISPGAAPDIDVSSNIRKQADEIVKEFMAINPDVNIHLRYLPEKYLLKTIGRYSSMGLGPDVMISRVPIAQEMAARGYTTPIDISTAELEESRPRYLSFFRAGKIYYALPLLLQPSLACYNKQRISSAPTELSQLTYLADQGKRIGLSLRLDEIFWTATGFGAQTPILQLFERKTSDNKAKPLSPEERARVISWLNWLINANLLFADNRQDLTIKLKNGQLDWIVCNATSIRQLQKALGPNLGLSRLPRSSKGTPSRPFVNLLVMSFGKDSTSRQRELSKEFALFSLNDLTQKSLLKRNLGTMPVNQNVVIPSKDSQELEILEKSLPDSIMLTFNGGLRLYYDSDATSKLLLRAVYGRLTASEALAEIEKLSNKPASMNK